MATNEKLPKYDGKEKVAGSLIYLTNQRPDIVHAVSIVSKFMNEPSTSYSSKNHSQVCISKAQRVMESCTRPKTIASSQHIPTATGPDASTIGRVQVATCSSWDPNPSHGHQRNKQRWPEEEAEYWPQVRHVKEFGLRGFSVIYSTEEPTTIYCDNM